MKNLLKLSIFLFSFALFVGMPIKGLNADGNDLVIVDMVSSATIPGSTVVPIEIKVEHQDKSLEQFLNVELEMRWNSGVIQNYNMEDNGMSGDKVEGDGIYTALISADSGLGENILCQSKSEAKRMLAQSAVKVDGKKVTREDFLIKINKKTLIQVGKRRHLKITLKSSN